MLIFFVYIKCDVVEGKRIDVQVSYFGQYNFNLLYKQFNFEEKFSRVYRVVIYQCGWSIGLR